MKTEFLKTMGLTDEQVADIMKENGKDVEAAKAKFSDYDDIKAQLSEAGKTIDGFKAMDIESIKKSAEDYKAKAEQAEKDAAEKIADMTFTSLLDGTIASAKGKNAKAIRAMLDMDTLKASKNQSEDIKAALEAIKESDGYLFESAETPPPYAGGTGTRQMNTNGDDTLRAAMGLAPTTK